MMSADLGESQVRKLQNDTEWFDAVDSNNVDVVKASVSKFKGSRTPSGDTALMIAAHKGYFTIAKLLHNYEARLQNTDGLSALMFATLAEQLEIANLLISDERDCVTPEGRDALMLGSEAGCSDMVSFLINHIPIRTDKYSRGALFYAASNLHITTIRILLESGKMPQSHVRDALTATTDTEVISIISEYLVPDVSYTSVDRIGTPGTPQNVSYQIVDNSSSTSRSPSVSSAASSSDISSSSKSENSSEKSPSISRSAIHSSSVLSPSANPTTQADNLTQASVSSSSSSSLSNPPTDTKGSSSSDTVSSKSTTSIASSSSPSSVQTDTVSASVTVSITTKEQDSIISMPHEDISRQTISSSIPRAISTTPAILQDEEDAQHGKENTELVLLNATLQELREQLQLKDLRIAELQVDLTDANTKKKMAIDAAALAKEALAAMSEQVNSQQHSKQQQAEESSAQLAEKTEKLERELSIMHKGYNALASSKAEFAEIIETLKRKLAEYEKGGTLGSTIDSLGSSANSTLLYDLQQQLQCLINANSQLNDLLNDKSNLIDRMSNELTAVMQNHAREIAFYKDRIHALMGQSDKNITRSELVDPVPYLLEDTGKTTHSTRECKSSTPIDALTSDFDDRLRLPNSSFIKTHSPSSSIPDGLEQLAILQAELDVMRKVNGSLSEAQANNQVEITRLRMKVDELLGTKSQALTTLHRDTLESQTDFLNTEFTGSKESFVRSPSHNPQLSPAARAELAQMREKVQEKNALLKTLKRIGSNGDLEKTKPIFSLLERNLNSGGKEDLMIVRYLLSLEEENQFLKHKLTLVTDKDHFSQSLEDNKSGHSASSVMTEEDADIKVAMHRVANIKRSLDTVTGVADAISNNIIKIKSREISPLDVRSPHTALRDPDNIIRSDFTPLMIAIIHKDINAVKDNLKYAGLSCADGTTGLMLAAQYGFSEVVPLLVPTEATMRRRDNATALSLALKMQNWELAELLRATEGLDIRGLSYAGGRVTELMQAAKKNDVVAVWSFLPVQSGLQDAQGCTALAYAVDAGAVEAARLLAPSEAQLVDFEGYNVIDRIVASTTIPTTIKERLTREVAPYIRADQL
ncbi:Hypothetical protein GLP15_3791 [Giardia lamblia P15]|uniref:Ankyrin repeat protein n=1 Tax=Giardia intestinalis (strain P15) TaxID=658858 RepID=E1F242_GIAIA|nr:Hypothetical protein GLP15_3791 [Giardia lamblia P15]